MEDGSIFVCFLCEKEFRQVALLQQHMTEHGTLPEMSEEFPSRKKAKTPQNEAGKSKGLVSKKVRTEFNRGSVSVQNNENYCNKSDVRFDKPKVKFVQKVIHVPKVKPTLRVAPPKESSNEQILLSKVKVKEENPPSTPVKVKPDPDAQNEFSIAMQRAMKIKKYIERKENIAKRKMKFDTEDNNDEVVDDTNEFEGARESIMMVDSSFFNSGVSKPPIGPTIMSAEPDGFMVPEKISSGHSQVQKKKRNVRLKNENFLVQDVFFDDNLENEQNTNGFISDVASQVQVFSTGNPASHRGRGRGRGKRGRPLKIKEEQTDYESLRPGRRSKPRNSVDESSGQSYQCLECYKEFRSVSTMRVHMKSHSEVREIPCPYCDEVFPQRYILYEHLVNDHEESSNLTCPVCNKIFTRPDSLKSHMVRMHEENGGLNCYVCGKNFPSQGQLEMHVRVHTGERPFKCDICGKGFVQKVHLRTHLRTMHNMTETNSTPCRICEEKFDGRAGLREHYTLAHGLTTAKYKNQVAKLRKEGKIPEVLPPKIKVVDPSFRYQKVAISEMDEVPVEEVMTQVSSAASPSQNDVSKGKTSVYLTRRPGRKLKIKTRPEKPTSNTPGMGTVMNLISDEVMFTPVNFDLDNGQPKGRDQEELSIVESAFKVAEEMDQMRDGSSTILMTEDSGSSGIYYSLPIDMPEDADDEYAQFAAEHAHIDGADDFDHDENEMDTSTTDVSSSRSRRGAIVKAEPLEIYSDTLGSSQVVEMLTM